MYCLIVVLPEVTDDYTVFVSKLITKAVSRLTVSTNPILTVASDRLTNPTLVPG